MIKDYFERLLEIEHFRLVDSEHLAERGFTPKQMEKCQYRTIPVGSRRSAEYEMEQHIPDDVETVGPGMWGSRGQWRFGGSSGLLIPMRRSTGDVFGCKIRRVEIDTKDTASKYVALSTSPDKKGEGGDQKYPGGMPATSGCHWPLDWSDRGTESIVITEGELKADYCTMNAPENWPATVSIPGVSQWRMICEECKEMGIKTVILALDIDRNAPAVVVEGTANIKEAMSKGGIPDYNFDGGGKEGEAQTQLKRGPGRPKKMKVIRNPVADAICHMYKFFIENDIEVLMFDWDEEEGKGIDDVLANKGPQCFRRMEGDELREWVGQKEFEALGGDANSYDHMKSLYMNRSTDKIYCTRLKATLTPRTFVGDFGQDNIPKAVQQLGNSAIYDWAAGNIPRFDGLASHPGKEEDKVFKFAGQFLMNTSRSNPYLDSDDIGKEVGDISILTDHIDRIFPNEEEKEFFIDFLAHNIQYPGQKIRWAVLLQGPPGSGKSFFAYLMSYVLRKRNVSIPSNDVIHEPYTDWLVGKTMVFIEELKDMSGGKGKFELMNKLKPIITGDSFMHRQMRTAAYEVPNTSNIVALTNHHDAIKIDENERRYFISRHYELASTDPQYFTDLFNWVKDVDSTGTAGWQRAARWLMQRDIEKFHRLSSQSHAPSTEARKELIEESKSDLEQMIIDKIQAHEHPFSKDFIKVEHLLESFPQLFRGYKGVNTNRYVTTVVSKVVRKLEGLSNSDTIKMPGRANAKSGGAVNKGLLCIRNVEQWKARKPAERNAEYYAITGDPEHQIGNPLDKGTI